MSAPGRESGAETATLDEIVHRAERARRRRNRFWSALAGVFLLLAFAAAGSAVYFWHQLTTNEAFLNATLKRATEIVDEAVALAEKYNVPRAATLALLARADGLFVDMALYGQPTPDLRYRTAQMLVQFARNYAILGDTNKQLARETEAHGLLAGLAAEKPDDRTYQGDLSMSHDRIADVLHGQGKHAEALASYRVSLGIRERLAAADPSNARWQRDLAVSHYRIGRVLAAQDKLDAALASYQAHLAIYERLAAADPNNARWQRGLAIGYSNRASVYRAMGKLAEALAELRKGQQIIAATVEMAPGDAYSKEGLAWFDEQIAALERQMQSAQQ